MQILKYFGFIGLALTMANCASTDKHAVPIDTSAPDYVVKERNPAASPEWLQDFAKFRRENGGKGTHFFLGESGDVNDRISGCDIATLQAKKKIAQQIAQVITNKIASNKQGRLAIDPSDSSDPGMQRAFEDQIAGKSVAFLNGAIEYGTAWELRDCSRTNGHKRVFNCAVVVTISDQALQMAIQQSRSKAQEIVEDPEAKAAVKESLKDVDKEFASFTK